MKNDKTTSSDPFQFAAVENNTSTASRKLDLTPILIGTSNTRAQELMLIVGKNPDFHALANKALDNGEPQDLIDLITTVLGKTVETDSTILEGADDDQLSRLLESRRSDRSKAKTKGPRTSVSVCKTYISAMYAELVIRQYTGKPYTGQSGSTELDIEALAGDQDAITRKIKSLQSKKSRLNKLAAYDADAKIELTDVEAEIARLNELRPNTRMVTKTVVKDLSVDELREALKKVDVSSLSEEDQVKMTELMSKLG